MHVIPRDERLKLDANCDLLLSDALAALEDFNGTVDAKHWCALARSEQLTFYRAVASEPSGTNSSSQTGCGTQMLRFLVTGYLTGSLAQVTSGLYSDTSHELKTQQSVFLSGGNGSDSSSKSNTPPSLSSSSVDRRSGSRSTFSGTVFSNNSSIGNQQQQQMSNSLIDATVLHAEQDHHHRRAPFRFAGVKWYAWHSQDGSGDRDLLAYERSGATTMSGGDDDLYSNDDSYGNDNGQQEIMYHVVQSIERPPEMRLPPGMRHMKLSVCYLYREVCEDLVECFAVGEYPARGSALSQRGEDAAVSERVLTVSRALAVYSAKRLTRLIEKNRKLPVILSKKSCLRCSARRTVFDPLRTCCICKKSVCQSCRQEKAIFKLHVDTNKPETEVFCTKCLSRSKLPNTQQPVSVERVAQLRKESSLSRSSLNNNRLSIASAGSAGSGGNGNRGSIVSSASSSSLVSTVLSSPAQKQTQHSPPRSSRQQLAARAKANSTPGMFNYDALLHHYEVEKPMLVRPRTRTRASTLPSPLDNDNGNHNRNNNSNNIKHLSKVSAVKVKHEEQPLAAIPVDLLPSEDIADNLRKTQIGLPVILVDVKPLRETQLGIPVEIESGRLSEPILKTTSHSTFFGAWAAPREERGRGGDGEDIPRASSITTLSPRDSPTRRSDLYLAGDGPAADGGGGVERLYQTYLERREKLQTEETSDEQELRNSRLARGREQQTQFRIRRSDEALPPSSSRSPTSPISQYQIFAAVRQSEHLTGLATGGADLDGGRRHQQQEGAPPKKHDFHMDLYAPF